ncbi:MAG: hypothetical protein FWD66_06750 [Paludibacter sp.]|nr:hypothetical protein [Paludibacter sp.]
MQISRICLKGRSLSSSPTLPEGEGVPPPLSEVRWGLFLRRLRYRLPAVMKIIALQAK